MNCLTFNTPETFSSNLDSPGHKKMARINLLDTQLYAQASLPYVNFLLRFEKKPTIQVLKFYLVHSAT